MLFSTSGLRASRCVESLLILCLCFAFFTGCEKDDALTPATELTGDLITKRNESSGQDNTEDANMERIANAAREFDAQLSMWRNGRDSRDRVSATEAADQIEMVVNLKVASGVNYKDATTVIDSIDVSSGDSWTGGTVARVYEKTKSILVSGIGELRGRHPGVRFVDISTPTKAADGTTRVYVTAVIGSTVQTQQPSFVSSHLVWGGANTTPASCNVSAEPEIATVVNFELDACYTGNPIPPMGTCGFVSIVKAGVNVTGGTVGVIPTDLTYRNRDWPSSTPASNGPAFVNEGEFVWHQDNEQDEICFNLTKFSQYVDNQVEVIEGPMLTDARAIPGFVSIGPFSFNAGPFRRPMGEWLVSAETIIVGNDFQIVDINAHFAFVDYGYRFFFLQPVFELQSVREM